MWLILLLCGIVTALIYALFFKKSKRFWEELGITQVHHSSLKDNLDIFTGRKTGADFDEIAYKSLGENGKFCGVVQLGTPMFLPKDMEVIKDFDHFSDRRQFASAKAQPVLGKMLANLHGEEWKGVRTSLSPTFTTGKIRRMMECFNKVSNEWANHFNERIKNNGGNGINIKVTDETTSYTVDVIASAVLGINVCTIKEPGSDFSKMSKQLVAFNILTLIKFALQFFFPAFVDFFSINIIDDEALKFFEAFLFKSLKLREEGKGKRNDFLQLIVEARQGKLDGKGSDELSAFEKEALLHNINELGKNRLTDDLIAVAQLIGFYFAGFSTTSNFIGTVMYTLALNQDAQDKLREEVNSKLFKEGDEDLDYDLLNKLPYLDMVLSEVLRQHPALARIERVCVKDYHDPESGVRVPKGTIVAIPVQAIHNDPKYYEHPDKFYPEHFTPEQKAKRNQYAWLPFGTGPRNCIGMRFALVESKAAIASLVHRFKLEPTEKTPIPQKMKPAVITLQVPTDLELKLSPNIII